MLPRNAKENGSTRQDDILILQFKWKEMLVEKEWWTNATFFYVTIYLLAIKWTYWQIIIKASVYLLVLFTMTAKHAKPITFAPYKLIHIT